MAIKIQQVDPAYILKSRVDLTLDYVFNIIRSPLHGYSHSSALINKPNEFVLHFLSESNFLVGQSSWSSLDH